MFFGVNFGLLFYLNPLTVNKQKHFVQFDDTMIPFYDNNDGNW